MTSQTMPGINIRNVVLNHVCHSVSFCALRVSFSQASGILIFMDDLVEFCLIFFVKGRRRTKLAVISCHEHLPEL